MRVKVLKAFALILFLGLAGTSFGQAPYALLSMTNTWRYNQGGTNLGVPWRGTNYVDSAWPQGRGAFGFDTNASSLLSSQILTPLTLSNASNVKISTYYFRTHFTLTNNPFDVTVTITNLIDDGAVFYVNSNEVQRLNMPAAPATIAYLTTASSSIDATYKAFIVPASALVRGDNTLAVEVHNASASSLDIGFGLAATVSYPPATLLVITNQPNSTNVAEFSQATLTVGVSGSPISYLQWFHESNAIPGANTLSYAITNAQISDGGNYTLVLSNATGSVTSSPAFVGIIADTNGPVIVSADGTDTTTNVLVTFSEVVLDSSLTNIANYVVTNVGGGTLPVTKAAKASVTSVTLTTSGPRLANTNYLVIASVRDNSTHTNLSVSAFPIATSISLLDEFAYYYFYNPDISFGDPPTPSPNWKNRGFQPYVDDPGTLWGDNGVARGIFWYADDTGGVPGTPGKKLQQIGGSTVFFRTDFNFNVSPLGAVLNLERLAEDGAVFYLNGAELMRVNMPTGPITSTTLASSDRNAAWEGPSALPGVQMSAGTNTLAVELHTATTFALSYTYSARITADINSYALGPVVITTQPTNTTVFEGQTATFTFNGVGPAYFQWRSNGVNIAGATNPVLTVPNVLFSMNSNRYSVVASNKSFSATSSNAVLTVLTDTNPPSLLSAFAISPNQIIASFSKNVTPATATVIGNYVITNRTAANLPISSIVLTNGTNVILTVGTVSGATGDSVLVVNNVQDTAISHNVIWPNSAVTIGLNYTVPIDTVWAYNASGLDLNTSWIPRTYVEGSGWSNGPALLYNEGAGLPGPKNTPLPLSVPPNGYIFTFYFRKHMVIPVGASSAVVQLRHIIDDGAVFYINGSEFYRFNMPAGAVAFNTQATAPAVGDAVYTPATGTLNFSWNNLVGGDNVAAVEVHQSGTGSSDIVFGSEWTLSSPSTRFPTNRPVVAKLFISKVPTPFTISWTNNPGYQLQGKGNIATNVPWTNVTSGITTGATLTTFSINVTNKPPGFFRLIKP
jgi:hypothetical protein